MHVVTCHVFIGSLKHKNKIKKLLCEFPLAAVPQGHKLSGLEQRTFSYSLEVKCLTQGSLESQGQFLLEAQGGSASWPVEGTEFLSSWPLSPSSDPAG